MGNSNSCKWIMLEQSNCYELVEWDVSYVLSSPQPHCRSSPILIVIPTFSYSTILVDKWTDTVSTVICLEKVDVTLSTVLVQRSRLLVVDDTLCYLCAHQLINHLLANTIKAEHSANADWYYQRLACQVFHRQSWSRLMLPKSWWRYICLSSKYVFKCQ